ncbi:MAG: transcriptional regulator [Pseudomonadota bacterium]|nr:transcriptional regulator [Xanthomonadaceae bacterium]MDE3210168.1 transcriptional regulator [Pseudomonadota bacterium]
MQQIPPPSPNGTFSDRIRLLIQRVGSATEIARMCGFSEGVVRSWRDGNTDPSRARCVTLAKTLGISLVWLVAGEGSIQLDPSANFQEDQYSSEIVTTQRPRARLGSVSAAPLQAGAKSLDTQRLNKAMQILQSELDLAESPLTLGESTDMLTELYEILGPGGTNVDTSAMMAFNRKLGERIRQSRVLV